MEFKGPKTYKPSFNHPSPSRDEMWRSELGFEDDDSTDDTSDEEPEVDQLSNNVTIMVELQSLQVEIQKKDKQREDLLLKLKALTDKTASYKSRLNKTEQNKKSQMKIMKRTHEVFIEQKDKLITDLQEMLSEHEKTLEAQGAKGKKKGKGTKATAAALPGIDRLVESITTLHEEKAKLTECTLVAQSELEVAKEEAMDNASKYRNQISDLQIEIRKMKSISEQDVGKENIDVSSGRIARLEEQNKSLRQEKKDLENEMWKTQESLRDEIRRLEDDVRTTSKKMRDAESKYVNLAATPPKVQVRTVQVVSEELKRELEEAVSQNRKVEALLAKTKAEHNAKVQELESERMNELTQLKTEHASMIQELESRQLRQKSELEQTKAEHNLKVQELESERMNELTQLKAEHASKVSEIEREIAGVKERCRHEIERMSMEKQVEIEEVKLEAERTTGGLRKLYRSLQENCLNLMKESQDLRRCQQELNSACSTFTTSLKPICRDTYKKIIEKLAAISEDNKDLERRYIKEMKLRKRLHNELVDLKGNIRVYCRVRPFISEDGVRASSQNSTISFDHSDDSVLSVDNKGTVKHFEMERVFQPTSTQEQVFSEVEELVVSCLDGYNICIFAYGQTGSGKTFTMEGPADNPGINQRALRHLFDSIEARSRDWVYSVSVNVLEIYNETIRDLLSSEQTQKLEMKLGADGLNHVRGLTDFQVENIDHVNELFTLGKRNRATAITNMNEHSSRSHAILRVTVSGTHEATGTTVTGKLNLVDLAGSERVNKSGSEGLRMKEAQNINKSLSSLGDVIHALKNKHGHVPYRNSKLTFLLQDSLGGDSKTLMVVQVSPALKNVGETLCSLNFAQRVRMVELGQATKKVESGEPKPVTPSKSKRNVTPRR
ncbi:kinesin-like protein KIFC3 [Dendronephthya gigantea]|uniref:kinesin-like protein KIFC3 n=1 Tax=Dendronephthya gigantea TaxID=151771 RepID=UPI0010695D39|nr:kinesin-like protein KIFC3 [Dendronephthya gigantea]